MMRCPFIMTSEHNNRYEDRREKNLDDIYRVIRSIDGKVEKILDEVCDLDCGTADYRNGWTISDLFDDEEVY